MMKVALTPLKYIVLLAFSLFILLPLIVVILGSFKTNTEFYQSSPFALPHHWEWTNYKTAFINGKMITGFKNTLIILSVSLTGSIMSGTTISYVFSRFEFKGKRILKNMFLFAALVPSVTTQVASFQIITKLGVFNTLLAPIVLYVGTDIMAIYIFMQFIDNISRELDESALLDGATYYRIFFRIIVPLLTPAIVTIVVISGVGMYNDFYTPFLYMPSTELATISTSLFRFKGPYDTSWEVVNAGIVIVILPMLVAFLWLQKFIYNGLTSGSVK
jgi:raffinose/stachyose/melibiose transport system permease protein